jgi:hypothetical protein
VVSSRAWSAAMITVAVSCAIAVSLLTSGPDLGVQIFVLMFEATMVVYCTVQIIRVGTREQRKRNHR